MQTKWPEKREFTTEMPGWQFASDNVAGICPEAMTTLTEANMGAEPSYGDDRWTARACQLLREVFETECEVFFVFNGTAANSLAISSCCQSYHSILCHELAHVETDECGAPEFFSNGTKLLLLPGELGRIEPKAIDRLVKKRTDIHFPKPQVVSVTESTEVGTVYRPEHLHAIRDAARQHGLKLHMDGARFANAVASMGVTPKEVTWQAGVDVLCFGGTKNGFPVGEAVVFFNKGLASEFAYRCKQAGQLASKMRFLSAPWVGLLEDGIWLRNADHANKMAAMLEAGMRGLGIEVIFPREANSVFVRLPSDVATGLRSRGWHFYEFIGAGGARFMCSWDTRKESIDALISDIQGLKAERSQAGGAVESLV
jgi:threonine aldolase